ncbi:cobalt-precorrin 5A hydrolase [Geotalea sp. SG265]|uniref:cobalt-precorrin 5A hydrolase n=1 Tax=Geotalea sp. SG265 TaxID=2922867 RepID=UPI001FAFFB51|nr:cobalt-precorrin 5A hydrolase [Geotalea sp. SG265]
MRIAIIAITRNGARLGAQISEGFSKADFYVLQKFAGAAGKKTLPFIGELKELVRRLWPETEGFVFIMATGIVVRMIAPLLEAKDKDPAVVVMDDGGRFAISLLSGHLGGANELAGRCAFLTGAREVITTATDANNLPSFDMLAKEEGWVIDELSRVKVLNSLLLEGAEIAVVDGTGRVRSRFHGRCPLSFFDTYIEALQSRARGYLFVTNRQLPLQVQSEKLLILRPQNLVLGIGCNSGTPASEIEALVVANMKRLFLSMKSLKCVASAAAKATEPGLLEFAERYGLPLVCYESEELNRITSPSPPSTHALAAIGAVGVAEPAALLASVGGTLLLKKVKSGNVTMAIAECPDA